MTVQLPKSDDQLHTLMLDASSHVGSVEDFFEVVAGLALNRGLTNQIPPERENFGEKINATGFRRGQLNIADADKMRIYDAFWDLLIEGIVRPGFDAGNHKLPWIHVTEIGKRLVTNKTPSPFDHDGYLARCRADIPNIDPVIVTYLAESLRTFRIGCYLASTVTLGCAAEKSLLLLMDATADALPSPAGLTFRAKIEPKMMRGKFEEFHKILEGRIRPALKQSHRDLDDFLDVQLDGIFDIIRTQRNAAGHPEGFNIGQDVAHANLYAFMSFLRRVYLLIQWLKTGPTL